MSQRYLRTKLVVYGKKMILKYEKRICFLICSFGRGTLVGSVVGWYDEAKPCECCGARLSQTRTDESTGGTEKCVRVRMWKERKVPETVYIVAQDESWTRCGGRRKLLKWQVNGAAAKWRAWHCSSAPPTSIPGGAKKPLHEIDSVPRPLDTFYRSHARFMTPKIIIGTRYHRFKNKRFCHWYLSRQRHEWSSWQDPWANRNVTKISSFAKNKLFFIFHSAFLTRPWLTAMLWSPCHTNLPVTANIIREWILELSR